jgi:hypothetical protein
VFFCSNYTMLNFNLCRKASTDYASCQKMKGSVQSCLVWQKNLVLGSSIYIVLYLIQLPEINRNCAHVRSLQPLWLYLCSVCTVKFSVLKEK